jgi:aquaglyceroporin related protein
MQPNKISRDDLTKCEEDEAIGGSPPRSSQSQGLPILLEGNPSSLFNSRYSASFDSFRMERPNHPRMDTTLSRRTNNSIRPGASRNEGTQNTMPEQALPPQSQEAAERPQFSLAGSYAPPQQEPAYVDPEYYGLNPNYNKPKNKPLWGLAKPLPRVVRPGMRSRDDRRNKKGKDDGTTAVETQGDQGTAPIPEVDMIPSQRRDEQPRRKTSRKTSKPKPSPGSVPVTPTGSNAGSLFDKYGTPKDEKDDPLEHWQSAEAHQQRASDASQDRAAARHMYDEAGVGDQQLSRLSSVEEVDSHGQQQGSAIEEGDAPHTQDLEAAATGDKLDLGWVDDDTALEKYEMAEADHVYNKWSKVRLTLREPFAEGLAVSLFTFLNRHQLTDRRQWWQFSLA